MRLKGMVKNMKKLKLPESTISLFENIAYISDDEGAFVKLMDEMLDQEQILAIWAGNGSCDGGGKQGKAFASENADKSLAERIELLKNSNQITENADGTFSAERACHCITLRGEKFLISPTYYGCGAAASIYNFERALGVKLKLLSYQASPNPTPSYTPCLFTFKIAD